MAKDKDKKEKKPKVHKDLEGLNIEINSFGEVKSSFNIDKINDFLNDNVEDKKLSERDGDFDGKGNRKDEEEE